MKFRFIFILISLIFWFCNCSSTKKIATNDNTSQIVSSEESQLKSLLIEATTEKILGNLDDADSLFNLCLKIDAKNSASLYELSGIALEKNDKQKALDYAIRSVKFQRDNEWYKLNLALICIANNKELEAISIFEQLILEHPNRYEYLYSLSDSYINIGEYKKAISPLSKLEQLIGLNPELLIHKHRLFLQIGEIDKAVSEIQKLISADPKEVHYYGILAEIFERTGDDEKALAQYSKIQSIDPSNGVVNVSLYQHYLQKENFKKATSFLLPAFLSKEVKLETKIDILLQLFNKFKSDQKIKSLVYDLCFSLIDVHPDNSKSYTILADFLLEDNQPEKGLIYFKKAAEIDQQSFAIWSQLVLLESSLDKIEALIEDSKTAIELFPNQTSFYYFNGYGHYRNNEFNAAISILNSGKELIIDNNYQLSDFYQLLGDAYHMTNNPTKSDESFESCLNLNPNSALALNNYSYYLSLRKIKLEKAKKMILKAIEINSENFSYLDTYGWILFLSQNYSDAEFWLQKSLDYGGINSGTVLEHYGDVLYKLNRTSEALDFWKKAKDKGDYSDRLLDKIAGKKYIE